MKLPMTETLDHVAIGSQAKAARVKAKKTQAEVAAKLRISASMLCDLEYGRRNWTEERFEQFKKALK